MARISAKIDGNVLRIFATGDFNTQKPIFLKVKLAKLNEITLRSSGDIQLEKSETDKLNVVLYGSGSIKATDVTSDTIKAKIAGSGDIELAGKLQTSRLKWMAQEPFMPTSYSRLL